MKKLLASILICFIGAAFADAPFTPIPAGTKTVSCTNTTATTALPAGITSQSATLEIQNVGPATVFVEVGLSTITAVVVTGYPVLAGQSKVITVAPTTTHIACIAAVAGPTVVYVSTGSGY